MHTLKLNIQDKVFDKVYYFLSNLPKDEVTILEDTISSNLEEIEIKAFSNHSANQITEWKDITEDSIWK